MICIDQSEASITCRGAADEIVELGKDVINVDVEVSLSDGRLPGGPGLCLQAAGEVSEHLRWLGESLLQLYGPMRSKN